MPVLDGEDVKAAVINRAKLEKESDDTAVGKITLANGDVISGATIANIQALMNANRIATGADETDDTVATAYGTPTTITNGTSHKAALIALDAVSGAGGILKQARWKKSAPIFSVSGTSANVSPQFDSGTEDPSTGPTVEGVVVLDPDNKIFIQEQTGDDKRDVFRDSLDNIVYGKLTESGDVWTLSFFVDIAGVETVFSFPNPEDMVFFYQKIFNLATNVPAFDTVLWEIFGDRLGGAGAVPSAEEVRAGTVTLASGISERTVTFSSPFSDEFYRVFCFIANITDTDIQFQTAIVTTKNAADFTAKWSADTDSANYVLCFIAQRVNGDDSQTNTQPLTSGEDTKVITFTDVGTTNYSVVPQLVNLTDADPQIMPIVVTAKATGSFTVQLPAGVDSNNYGIDWIVSLHANAVGRQDSESVGSAQDTRVVVFADIGSVNYAMALVLSNVVDGSSSQIQPVSSTVKNTDGFTAAWPADTENANYVLEYIVREHE